MVLTDTEQQIKISGQSEYFRPDWAIVDPQLTYSCPRQVAADSGIDALTHAIEAITTVDFDQLEIPLGETCAYDGRTELTSSLAERAIRICGKSLISAVNSPDDYQAKDQVCWPQPWPEWFFPIAEWHWFTRWNIRWEVSFIVHTDWATAYCSLMSCSLIFNPGSPTFAKKSRGG